jgi:hypothetical protein
LQPNSLLSERPGIASQFQFVAGKFPDPERTGNFFGRTGNLFVETGNSFSLISFLFMETSKLGQRRRADDSRNSSTPGVARPAAHETVYRVVGTVPPLETRTRRR